ncbi:fucose isomerase [Sphingobacterium sp. JB170]|uniref:fucose isomerase n=1 Tax=Sphingobacterium sp. JB170 TaxID=1434842 RepID=UPI00097F01F2|nr:fucose isomerase [Sphingobacterium sp. JB170]SJN45954.1 putative L-fucose isomerase [Sphingobacterium sp. JB170]
MENKTAYLVCSGDLRPSANTSCWPTQQAMEEKLAKAFDKQGWKIVRAHGVDPKKGHGFIDYQSYGIEVFKGIDPQAALVVAESVWQYSHHVLAGLLSHRGPILLVANWDGTYPGLVGALNLTGSMTKAGIDYSFLWSVDFEDDFFKKGLQQWMEIGKVHHDTSHVRDFLSSELTTEEGNTVSQFVQGIARNKVVMGVFDEGCMGMFNAIFPDHLLHPLFFFKERLSQSTLYAKMLTVSDKEAEDILQWLLDQGMKFHWGENEEMELTRRQTLEQCKMYIAVLRLSDEFGCDTVGIQYQQGLKELAPASDLVEGLLNNTHRPPAYDETGKELYANAAMPHFNEVDECAGVDGYITYHLWKELGLQGDNTLHDLRYGEDYLVDGINQFVWVFLISGAAPASHFIDGYRGADSLRQPPMFFGQGGGTLRGISKPGKIVWSRIYIQDDQVHCDLGTGKVVALPIEETQRRWQMTNPEWPIMHGVLDGVSRDQMMAQHKANHIQVVYVDDTYDIESALRVKAGVMDSLGIRVHLCGGQSEDAR